MAYQFVFKRVEYKYLLDSVRYETVISEIEKHMRIDEYGETTICNVYFDTGSDRLIQISLDSPVYKEKLRLRSYGIPNNDDYTVFLEIKKKLKGTVYKRRIAMTLAQAEQYIQSGVFPEDIPGNIPREIDYMVHFWELKPRVFIACERVAYYCDDNPDLRITFDKNIRSRYTDVDFRHGDGGARLLPEGTYLMEIKIPNSAPLWLTKLLSENGVFRQSFSKYGSVYINKTIEEANKNVQ